MKPLNKKQIHKIYRVVCKHPRFSRMCIMKDHIALVVGYTDYMGSGKEVITVDEDGELVDFDAHLANYPGHYYSGYGFGYGQ